MRFTGLKDIGNRRKNVSQMCGKQKFASRDRWEKLTGWRGDLSGQKILEAGCGAGRFTEIALDTGAEAPLPAVSVEDVGGIAVIRPGTGDVTLPAGARSPFRGPALPHRGKLASEMVIEDRR